MVYDITDCNPYQLVRQLESKCRGMSEEETASYIRRNLGPGMERYITNRSQKIEQTSVFVTPVTDLGVYQISEKAIELADNTKEQPRDEEVILLTEEVKD